MEWAGYPVWCLSAPGWPALRSGDRRVPWRKAGKGACVANRHGGAERLGAVQVAKGDISGAGVEQVGGSGFLPPITRRRSESSDTSPPATCRWPLSTIGRPCAFCASAVIMRVYSPASPSASRSEGRQKGTAASHAAVMPSAFFRGIQIRSISGVRSWRGSPR